MVLPVRLTGPQVCNYVDFCIKSIVSTKTKLTSTAIRYCRVYLKRNQIVWYCTKNKNRFYLIN